MVMIRLKFTKGDEVKYISHLDLQKTFQRAVCRSGIDVCYSQGFNPHQEMSFGAPLALGTTSHAEYVDVKMNTKPDMVQLIKIINNSLPMGLFINGGVILGEKAKNVMSIVERSLYSIKIMVGEQDKRIVEQKIIEFMGQTSIIAKKEQFKKKNAILEVEIKEMIKALHFVSYEDQELTLTCLLDAGSRSNLKPELLIDTLCQYAGWAIGKIKINREETYASSGGKFIDLLEAGR